MNQNKLDHHPITLSMPRPISLAMDDDDKNKREDGSVWVELLTAGNALRFDWWEAEYFDMKITKDDLSKIAQNFNKETNDIPYNRIHSTYLDDGAALGWVREVELRNNGQSLFGRSDFMADTKTLIEEERYKYVSAELSFLDAEEGNTHDYQKPATHLSGVALTNYPGKRSMQAIALSMSQAYQPPPHKGEQTMSTETTVVETEPTPTAEPTPTVQPEQTLAQRALRGELTAEEQTQMFSQAQAAEQAQASLRANQITQMLEGHRDRGALSPADLEVYKTELSGTPTDRFEQQYNLVDGLLKGRADNSVVNLGLPTGNVGGNGDETDTAAEIQKAYDETYKLHIAQGLGKPQAMMKTNESIRQKFAQDQSGLIQFYQNFVSPV